MSLGFDFAMLDESLTSERNTAYALVGGAFLSVELEH
jgi:hypothetical protein